MDNVDLLVEHQGYHYGGKKPLPIQILGEDLIEKRERAVRKYDGGRAHWLIAMRSKVEMASFEPLVYK